LRYDATCSCFELSTPAAGGESLGYPLDPIGSGLYPLAEETGKCREILFTAAMIVIMVVPADNPLKEMLSLPTGSAGNSP
jgi:hypothetical protein